MKNGATPYNLSEYTHGPLDESIVAIGGSCRITEEKRMVYGREEVLYLMGLAHMDNACCGSWGCSYAVVKGLIKDWKCKVDHQGYAITRVLPVTDPKEQERIRNMIMSEEMVQQVIFN